MNEPTKAERVRVSLCSTIERLEELRSKRKITKDRRVEIDQLIHKLKECVNLLESKSESSKHVGSKLISVIATISSWFLDNFRE